MEETMKDLLRILLDHTLQDNNHLQILLLLFQRLLTIFH